MTVPAGGVSRDGVVWTDRRAIRGLDHVARFDAALLFIEQHAVSQVTALFVFQSIVMIALRCHLFHKETGQVFQRKCRSGIRH